LEMLRITGSFEDGVVCWSTSFAQNDLLLRRGLFVLIVLILTVFLPIAATAGKERKIDANPDHSSDIYLAGDLLTVRAKDVPLQKILKEIADLTGIKVVYNGPADALVSAHFSDVSLYSGLKRLLRGFSYVLVSAKNSDSSVEPRIAQITVFSQNRGNSQHSQDPQRRSRVNPGGLPDPSLESLVTRLKNSNPEIRQQTVDQLGDLMDDRAIAPLSEVLAKDPDASIRASAAEALGDIGEEAARGVLEEALRDPHVLVRRSAVEALGEMGGSDSIYALQEALNDQDKAVRNLAAEALEELKEAKEDIAE
jgi:hypothetical protein